MKRHVVIIVTFALLAWGTTAVVLQGSAEDERSSISGVYRGTAHGVHEARFLSPRAIAALVLTSGMPLRSAEKLFYFAACLATFLLMWVWLKELGLTPSAQFAGVVSTAFAIVVGLTYNQPTCGVGLRYSFDIPAIAFICALGIAAKRGRLMAFYSILVLACLNRETAVTIAPYFAACEWRRHGARSALLHVVAMVTVSAAIRVILLIAVGNGDPVFLLPLKDDIRHFFGGSLSGNLIVWGHLVVAIGGLWPLAFVGAADRRSDIGLRISFLCAVMILVPVTLWAEIRVWLGLLPFAVPLALFAASDTSPRQRLKIDQMPTEYSHES